MRTVIIGIGNPLLTDDRVGINVVRSLHAKLDNRDDVECHELYTGGIRLMESMVGYNRAYVIDAMVTGKHVPGTICSFPADDCSYICHAASPHDADITTSIAMGKALGLALPEEIRIWGIEAADVATFSEELTPAVAAAVPLVTAEIIHQLDLALGAET